MSYLLHGATLAGAWFLVLNVLLSAAVAVSARHVRPSASLLLAARLFPGAASMAFVAGVFIPSHWQLEPPNSTERFDVTLTVLAAAALVLIVSASARGAAAWWRATRRARAWARTAEPLALAGVGVPAFSVDAAEPVMALAGVLRSRLLVTRGLIEALTPEELAASVAHEIGHHRAWDNLKRLAILGAPDLLTWTPAARALERNWAAASEYNADAAASIGGDPSARFALASALVKVARLMPAAAPVAEPISPLVGSAEIASRVDSLLGDPARPARSSDVAVGWWSLAASAAVSAAIIYGPLIARIHAITEIAVNRLP